MQRNSYSQAAAIIIHTYVLTYTQACTRAVAYTHRHTFIHTSGNLYDHELTLSFICFRGK